MSTVDRDVLTLILAGGEGARLRPLTKHRSKPAVAFGGNWRVIDFSLMSCLLSGTSEVRVLSQYQRDGLARHVQERWAPLWTRSDSLRVLSPQRGDSYLGTADAVYKSLLAEGGHRSVAVLVLSGDHVYRANYRELVERHLNARAAVTVLTGEVPVREASSFGVLETDADGRISRFVEKPENPQPFARAGVCSINLGVYCFDGPSLIAALAEDAVKPGSSHDFGKDVLPALVEQGRAVACPMREVSCGEVSYWRDVGTIESYFAAHMDLLSDTPLFELEDPRWDADSRFSRLVPRRVWRRPTAPHTVTGGSSLIDETAILGPAATLIRCVISANCRVARGAYLEECVVLPGAEIGPDTQMRRVIVEEGARVPSSTRVGSSEVTARSGLGDVGVSVFTGGTSALAPFGAARSVRSSVKQRPQLRRRRQRGRWR